VKKKTKVIGLVSGLAIIATAASLAIYQHISDDNAYTTAVAHHDANVAAAKAGLPAPYPAFLPPPTLPPRSTTPLGPRLPPLPPCGLGGMALTLMATTPVPPVPLVPTALRAR
jgi:hypothetical protein